MDTNHGAFRPAPLVAVSFPLSNNVILLPIAQTFRFFKPIFTTLGYLKNRDCTVYWIFNN